MAGGRVAPTALMLLLALTLAFTVSMLPAPRAHASGPDSATLQITSASPYVYGSYPVQVQMIVTLGTALNSLSDGEHDQSLHLNTGASFPLFWVSTSADQLTITYSGTISSGQNVLPGDYTATASFVNPDTTATTTTNSLSFTMEKAPTRISCYIYGGSGGIISIGQTFYINLSSGLTSTVAPGDTVTITLAGPQNISATLQADGNRNVHMAAPTLPGTYTVTCASAGNSLYNPGSATTTLNIHDDAHVAGMKLYTNPTTVTRGVALTFYIVLLPKPGYPAPTGYLDIKMGIIEYDSIQVGANGATLVELYPLPVYSTNPFSQITIDYGGDARYLNSTFNFPLTNPAISGSAPSSGTTASGKGGKSSGKSSGASATSTATVGTPTPTAAATATATAATTATVTSAPALAATRRTAAANSLVNPLLLWLAGGVAVLAII
ncbi:MAG: hypothetical protein ACRDID_04570, partial [Ktedonobacterales bacterium]